MLDPHIRTALPPVPGKPGEYSVTFRAPDRHGVFKFVIDYKRKGYVPHFPSLAPLSSFRTPSWRSRALQKTTLARADSSRNSFVWLFSGIPSSLLFAFTSFCSRSSMLILIPPLYSRHSTDGHICTVRQWCRWCRPGTTGTHASSVQPGRTMPALSAPALGSLSSLLCGWQVTRRRHVRGKRQRLSRKEYVR